MEVSTVLYLGDNHRAFDLNHKSIPTLNMWAVSEPKHMCQQQIANQGMPTDNISFFLDCSIVNEMDFFQILNKSLQTVI